ncbi:MAG: serine/threonine-protein kinase [bacterium]
MAEFFIWLSSNPFATSALIVSFGVVVTAITMIYLVAFLQGRSISFWPPRIGEKPNKTQGQKPKIDREITHPQRQDENEDLHSNPIIQKGMTVKTASGQRLTIESNFYGGANATLYRAKNSQGENVIVKVFWRGLMPSSPAWDLFSQEQRTAEILTHRNIVKIFDRGLQGGYPFIVMEYFAGGTLRDWLRTHDHIPGSDILAIAGQVADAIDFAHSRGVVHRDIKPGNILFESDPHSRVALGDFGIARIFGAVERDITAAGGEFIGSPGYLAPEAFEGRELSTATDIYSFGVVLYEMITGKIPFDEFQEVYAILQIKVSQDAPNIRAYRKGVSVEIAERLSLTLSRSSNKRPKSALAVLSGIETQIGKL